MKTQILIEIEHDKPLSERQPITDVVASRVYNYLYAQGVQAGVDAKIWQEVADVGVSVEVTEVV